MQYVAIHILKRKSPLQGKNKSSRSSRIKKRIKNKQTKNTPKQTNRMFYSKLFFFFIEYSKKVTKLF